MCFCFLYKYCYVSLFIYFLLFPSFLLSAFLSPVVQTDLDVANGKPTSKLTLLWHGQDGLAGGFSPWGRIGASRSGVG